MKYIFIDFNHEAVPISVLQNMEIGHSQIWLFLDKQLQMLPIDLCEILCRFGQNVHFIRLDVHEKNALSIYIAYHLGKVLSEDENAEITLLTSDNCFDNLAQYLLEQHHVKNQIQINQRQDIAVAISPEMPFEISSEQVTEQVTEQIVEQVSEMPSERRNDFSDIGFFYTDAELETELSLETEPKLESQPELTHQVAEESLLSPELIDKYVQITLMELLHHEAFRPMIRKNLETRLQRMVLNEELSHVSDEQQAQIVQAVVDELIEQGMITVDPQNELLEYHFSGADILSFLVNHLKHQRPATISEAQTILQAKAKWLNIEIDDKTQQDILLYCHASAMMRLNGQQIEYPPFASQQNNTESDEVFAEIT